MKTHSDKKKNITRIGVFDSGLGGLFLLKELSLRFSEKSFLYLADRAGFPYGEKPPALIRTLVTQNIDFLVNQGAQQIITACNTACSVLKAPYPVMVKEIISASLKQAYKSSLNKKVGLMATTATVQSGVFQKKAKELNMDLQIYQQACPGLAPFVEQEGWKIKLKEKNKKLLCLLKEYLTPLKDKGVDTVILGCTHYLYLKPAVRRFLGEGKKAVGPVETLIQDLQKEGAGANTPPTGKGSKKIRFFVRGKEENFKKQYLEIMK